MGQSRLFVSQVLLCAEVLRVPVDAFFYEDGEAKPKRPVELAIGEELLTAIRALPEKKLRALLALSRQLADKLQRPIG
jgi:predicted DNA-binding antitoxin AbrB/MazE fold protein